MPFTVEAKIMPSSDSCQLANVIFTKGQIARIIRIYFKLRVFVIFQKNKGQNGGKPKLDLNVEAAWAQGITGKNITTAVMDDGVDYMHPDLKFNYVS